ncbi:serine/threonine-protein kinase [Lachancea thermotolerans CBS 6340]|uniref:non-specific serine/threonine protein kinase n=1 Tax=Lachancea thermotolerans (strain ATCC 56472 / CBS 6340 / NRRL Y-8284) TaxID=559295 RepID=C5DHS6_LACTC|nr:KLTH0E06776p [Lachancea thermotolerans CBS 6340]CAR23337.1 KLTH0E06776p [Lachancea thermotolerans CBS 6340]
MGTHSHGNEEVDIPPNLQSKLNALLGHGAGVQLSKLHAEATDESSATSSADSLNLLLERQQQRQLNHPMHQEHIAASPAVAAATAAAAAVPPRKVKETTKISLEYDPISKRKVLNTYEIIGELGHGQHGKVKLARDLVTKQLVAIKIVDRNGGKSNRFSFKKRASGSDKIKREIAIMKKCHHEHVVKLIEVLDDSTSRKIYLVLEYCSNGEVKWCPGDQLETEARGPPLLTFQRAREIFRGVVLGLEYLHYQGIIHRDIKPANLLISGSGTVKISDFGVSFAASNTEGGYGSLDELELAKTAGTPAFFAPEICLGHEASEKFSSGQPAERKGLMISHKIDIWAIGVTLHCLLFGMLPFFSEFELELFDKIINENLALKPYADMASNGVSQISCVEEYNAAKDLLEKLLTKNPFERIDIPGIKRHPFVCWDFESTSDSASELSVDKLMEKLKFQRPQGEEYQQISISAHELNNAVCGIGNKLKRSALESMNISQKSDNDSSRTLTNFDKNGNNSNDFHDQFNDSIGDPIRFANSHIKTNTSAQASNGNLILSEGALMDPDNGEDGLSAREIFQQELQRFDSKRDSSAIVSLPVNSSFASLDSFYIDTYAGHQTAGETYSNSSSPLYERSSPTIFARPPPVYAGAKGASARLASYHNNPNASARNPHLNPRPIASSQLSYRSATIPSASNDRQIRPQARAPAAIGIGPRQGSGGDGSSRAAVRSKIVPRSLHPSTSQPPASKALDGGYHNGFLHGGDNESSRERFGNKPSAHVGPRRGNFFSNYDGSDEEDGYSTTSGTSSSYRNSGDSYSDEFQSETESLPFEFGIDSEHGSTVSLRDLAPVVAVPSFTERPTRNEPGGPKDADADDELMLNVGMSGHNRRQGSVSSASSSQRANRFKATNFPHSFAPPKFKTEIFEPIPEPKRYPSGSASTLTAENNGAILGTVMNFNQDTAEIAPDAEGFILDGNTDASVDVPVDVLNMIPELRASEVSEPSNNAHSFRDFTGGASTNWRSSASKSNPGPLVLPSKNPVATTQQSTVKPVLNTHSQTDNSRVTSKDLLQSVLTSSGSSRRPSMTPSRDNSRRETNTNSYVNHYEGKRETKYDSKTRPGRKPTQNRGLEGRYRSKSISVGLLEEGRQAGKSS